MEDENFEAFWLGYTCSSGNKVNILCDTDERAEVAFSEMFEDSGEDITYSVDNVSDLLNRFESQNL